MLSFVREHDSLEESSSVHSGSALLHIIHTHPDDQSSLLFEVLSDLSSRFFLNLPQAELAQWERIFYHLEQANWYYEDFLRVQQPALPKLELREFCKAFFEVCPVLIPHKDAFEELFDKSRKYVYSVPVCGSILLNKDMNKCVLIRGYGSKSWGFPKGKINQGESEVDCAIRETREEIGFDISNLIDQAVFLQGKGAKKIKLYVVFGVDEEKAQFETSTRNEISEIRWFNIDSLEKKSKFWNAQPFLAGLQKLIKEKKTKGSKSTKGKASKQKAKAPVEEKKSNLVNSAYLMNEQFDLFQGEKRWSVQEMLEQNARMYGVQPTQISNPNELADSMADVGNFYKDLRQGMSESSSPVKKKRSAASRSYVLSQSDGVLSDSENEGTIRSDFEFDTRVILKALNAKLFEGVQ